MKEWNVADVFETIAETVPDAPALVQGDRRVAWGEFDRRADGIAASLLDAGVERQDKVAAYLYNCPEYLETTFGTIKAGLVPVNTNYRYGDDEIVYLWDNADAVAVVFQGAFSERVDRVRSRLPKVKRWLWVDDGSGACPSWSAPYEEAASSASSRVAPPWGRSGDAIWMVYTGGTTGLPKGVMWRQHDLYLALLATSAADPPEPDLDHVRSRLAAPGPAALPACPLMHGTGLVVALFALHLGGRVVMIENRSFDAVEMWQTVEREKVNVIGIVGDAFAKPMLRALDDNPGRWDLGSVINIMSAGVMWSEPVKEGLLRHHPGMALSDLLGATEAMGMGRAVSSAAGVTTTASFELGEHARVIRDDGTDITPGSGEVGMVAVGALIPVGYYKDEEKTARLFRDIDGRRYSVPGDYATVEEDGTIHLVGRGSVCINTGGEKVFPEEVEEALKSHPAVRDAVVVGVPDERFGEAVIGVVEADEHAAPSLAEDELIAHVKSKIAAYKAPKRVLTVDSVGRSPSGKADYGATRRVALDRLGLTVPA